MATTKAPLFGFDASGGLAGSIVFSKWKGRTYVRQLVTPSNPRSGLQVGMRSVLKFITQAYSSLSDAIKAEWAALAASDNITAMNAQVRDAQTRARVNSGWRKGPSETPLTTIDAPTGGAAAAAPKSLNCSWTRPASNQGDYSAALYMSTTTGFTPDISNLVAVQDVTDVTVTIPNLTTGTAYYFKVRETSGAGELGTLSSQFTGTPT